jgi:hypothetical protein
MKRDILQEDLSVKQILAQIAFGAVVAFGFLAAAAMWDLLMHWISGC